MCVLVGSDPMARSAAGLTVTLRLRRDQDAGRRFCGRLFEGLAVDARVVRARARVHEDVAVSFATRVASGG